ncbi:hypothetical protein ACJMK2_033880 [Sinanodonta woodiana]|uniref:ENTH domain-containing protein n=1 Tax=Sinanodonta woodiana TaxID=1069815 RepID=A0ABD3WPT4_SINWO
MMPIRRTLKNVVKNYTDAQVKVREATSNDPWGPSSTLMSEIADLTYNVVAFTEIMQMVWKRLNDHGKNWRHVYKSLVLLDYIIKTGSEKVAQQCKENIYAIQTLKDFQYIEDNKDQGMNVREKAKQLVQLLKDDERLKNERAKALKAKERFAQNSMHGIGSSKVRGDAHSPTLQSGSGYSDTLGGYEESPKRRASSEFEQARPSSMGEEELQLQLALAMSREEHEEQVKKQKTDEIKLQLALEESRKQAEDEVSQPATLLDMANAKRNTDPWGTSAHRSPAADPWGTPLPGPPGSSYSRTESAASKSVTDPWSSPSSHPAPASDPWGVPSHPPAPAPDPWSAPPVSSHSPSWGSPGMPRTSASTAGASGFDSTFSGTVGPTANGTKSNTIDDDFDLLSSRPLGSAPTKQPALDGFDLLGGSSRSGDPWNMDGVSAALPSAQVTAHHRKTPEEFLGANSKLVNLDELVKTNQSKGVKNPFAASSTNPFEQPNQTQRVPLSQLQQSYNVPFIQTSSAGLLPAPLVPLTGQQMQPQQSYNPFL